MTKLSLQWSELNAALLCKMKTPTKKKKKKHALSKSSGSDREGAHGLQLEEPTLKFRSLCHLDIQARKFNFLPPTF